jgi:angio-associated migratory cell protein
LTKTTALHHKFRHSTMFPPVREDGHHGPTATDDGSQMETLDPVNDDDAPQFLVNDPRYEEVVVDDDIPMDDDDDDAAVAEQEEAGVDSEVVDMSRWKMHHTGPVYAVVTSVNDENLLVVSGGGDDVARHRVVALHDAATLPSNPSEPMTRLPFNHADSVSCVATNFAYATGEPKSPRLVAVAGYDGKIVIYNNVTDLAPRVVLEGPSDVEFLAFHPVGGTVLLAGSSTDGTVWMYHVLLQQCLQVLVGHVGAVTAGGFVAGGKMALTAGADGTLRFWAPRTGVCKTTLTFTAGLTCCADQQELLLLGAENGWAHVVHSGTRKLLVSLPHAAVEGDQGSVEAVGFCPTTIQPHWCATGGVDGVLKIWDWSMAQARQECVVPADTPGAGAGLTRLSWHGALVIVATTAGTVHVWDARAGTLLTTLTGHVDTINDLNVTAHGDENILITTASDDHTIRVFQVNVATLLSNQARPLT